MNDLELSILKFTLSRRTLWLKIKYIFLSMIFYPFIFLDEKKNKVKGKDDADTSSVGDDVYPLF